MLIRLDCAGLGPVEIFIRKTGRRLHFQLNIQEEPAYRLLSAQGEKLVQALQARGFTIEGFHVLMGKGFFRLTDSNPKYLKSEVQESAGQEPHRKRYAFDMRV